MNVAEWIPLLALFVGTAGIAGLVSALSKLRRSSRLKAQAERDLELAEKFAEGTPARNALQTSAALAATELAAMTLVRPSLMRQLVTRVVASVGFTATVLLIGEVRAMVRRSGHPFVEWMEVDDLSLSALFWVNYGILLLVFSYAMWCQPPVQIARSVAATRLLVMSTWRLRSNDLPIGIGWSAEDVLKGFSTVSHRPQRTSPDAGSGSSGALDVERSELVARDSV